MKRLWEYFKAFKVKVIPHGSSANYYAIHYKFQNSLTWHRLNECFLRDEEWLCTDEQPVLIENFDKAVHLASNLTVFKILRYNLQQRAKFNNHIKKIRERIAGRRYKYFQS